AQLWVVGGGDLSADLKLLAAKLAIEDYGRFFGVVSDDEKANLLQRSRCLVMPSRGEGFGGAYLEAMRRGRPCLVSTVDAGREVVNPPETGLEVNPDDEPALAEAVVRLLTPSDEWNKWSDAARCRYRTHFTAAAFQD